MLSAVGAVGPLARRDRVLDDRGEGGRSADGMKRKITSILAADVAEFSRLAAENEEDTLGRLMTAQALFRDEIGRHGGRVFNTAGDAILAEFASAVECVRAATAIQDEMARRNAAFATARRLEFRIGISIGDVVEHGDDLLGDGVNVAARLQTLAAPGGIAVSGWVTEQISGKINLPLRDLGKQSLRNIPSPVQVFVTTPAAAAPVARAAAWSPGWMALGFAVVIGGGVALWWGTRPATTTAVPTALPSPPVAAPVTNPTAAPTAPVATPVAVPPPAAPAVAPSPMPAPPSGSIVVVPPPAPPASIVLPAPPAPSADRKTVPTKDARPKAQRCTEILERAQLGELNEDDRAFLRGQCR